jgi:hypothetical protein
VNPGLLKLELAHYGADIDRSAMDRSEITAALQSAYPSDTAAHVTEPAIDLVLPGTPPERIDVRLSPPPAFYTRATSRGIPMRRIAAVYGSYLAVHPSAACGFSLRGLPCGPCAGRSQRPEESWRPEVSDVIEVVRAAFDEGAAEFVYFNTPFSASADRGVAQLEPYVKAIKRHFDTLVVAQLHPPEVDSWIDRAYAYGIDALSFNLEVCDPSALLRYFPGRVRHIGRDRYYAALEHAASIFPKGAVWSDLIVGLEPSSSTMQGIDQLLRLGVVPALGAPPLNSVADTAVPPPITVEHASVVGTHLYRAGKESGIHAGWLRDLSTTVTPLEARFFAGDEARLAVAVQNFYRSRVGSLAARNLARLRRRLRVRAVGDSFDASGL